MVALGGGAVSYERGIPVAVRPSISCSTVRPRRVLPTVDGSRGTSLIRNSHLHRFAIGPYAEAYCMFLREGRLLMSEVPLYYPQECRAPLGFGSPEDNARKNVVLRQVASP